MEQQRMNNPMNDRILKIEQALGHIQYLYETQTKLFMDKYDSMLIQVATVSAKTDNILTKIDQTTNNIAFLDDGHVRLETLIKSVKNVLNETSKVFNEENEMTEKELVVNHTGIITTNPNKVLGMLKDISAEVNPRSCADIQLSRANENLTNGVYVIHPSDKMVVEVFCDFETDGGGWTVFQRRDDVTPNINFQRNWNEYKWGFGDLNTEFWLGLEPVHLIMNGTSMTLRINLNDFEGNSTFAEYKFFLLESESKYYQLNVAWYSGTAGDSLSFHSGMNFSTKDRDLDKDTSRHCAVIRKGGWWFNNCLECNLNGEYYRGKRYADVILWQTFRGTSYSLKKTEMMMRPAYFKKF